MPQLSELVKAAGDTAINGRISFCPPARWVFQPETRDLLIQIEPGVSEGMLILNTTLARDGSGPLSPLLCPPCLLRKAMPPARPGWGFVPGRCRLHSLSVGQQPVCGQPDLCSCWKILSSWSAGPPIVWYHLPRRCRLQMINLARPRRAARNAARSRQRVPAGLSVCYPNTGSRQGTD